MKKLIASMLSILLVACGGGGGGSSQTTAPVVTAPAPMLTYGANFPVECQSSTISANSTDPANLADASSNSWTGNEYWPMTKGRYTAYCRHNITGVVSAKAAANGNYFITITSATYRDEGSISFYTMPCTSYGGTVHTMTYTTGLSAPLLGYVNLNVGMYDGEITYTDTNGNQMSGVAEMGNGGGLERGGILMIPNNPVVGQVINGSWTGETSCADSSPSQFTGTHKWTLSTIDTQDHFGLAVNPVQTTCLFEDAFGGATCYESSKDVGLIEAWTIQISDGAGHFNKNADGDYVGMGVIYTAIRQDRQGVSSPTGSDTPWTGDN